MSCTRHAAPSVLGSSAVAAGRKAISLTLIVALTSGSAVSLGAQTPPLPQAAPAGAQAIETLTLVSGRSIVLPTAFDVVRIAVTDPAIADAVVVVPREILIDGKAPGTVSLIVWGKAERRQYDVVVEPSAGSLQRQMRTLFPDDSITVSVTDEAIVLSGETASQDMVVRAGEIAQAASSKSKVINLLHVREKTAPNNQQVMLQVRFAEVDQTALRELGASFFALDKNVAARTTTQQFPAPEHDDDALAFTDYLNLFYLSRGSGIGVVIRALQQRGHFQSLAEPNLIAYNGQEASFLAGGEFPVPIAQGIGAGATISIQWKEFGVRLKFLPTITGDTIRLKVQPEVSTLDFANGLQLAGFRIPALSTRRAATDVELKDGQSFAIAGLLNNEAQETDSRVPLLGSLPIIGPLFRSKGTRGRRTELLVMVTPRLVRPLEAAEVPALPVEPGRFLQPRDVIRQMPGGAGPVDAPLPPVEPAKPKGAGSK